MVVVVVVVVVNAILICLNSDVGVDFLLPCVGGQPRFTLLIKVLWWVVGGGWLFNTVYTDIHINTNIHMYSCIHTDTQMNPTTRAGKIKKV